MRSIIIGLVLLGTTLPATGCFVSSRPHNNRAVHRNDRSCGPAHHWNGNRCVHNGRGHDKDKGRH